jgi:hypothetical protein
MSNRINIEYSITKDYSSLNNPNFVNILRIYNLILLPITNDTNRQPTVSDEITILNKTKNSKITQKVVLSTGYIQIFDREYYYFYIANGIPETNDEYCLLINNQPVELSKKLSPQHSAKILIGGLILDNDYRYMFDEKIPLLLNINNQYIKLSMTHMINKYNHYTALKNNTILFILNNQNINILQTINSSYLQYFMVRPLFYKDFPLGSFSMKISNYNGVLNGDGSTFNLLLNNKIIAVDGNEIYIENLVSGSYSIKIIDRTGFVYIDYLNNQLLDKDSFSFIIPSMDNSYQLGKQALPIPRQYVQPQKGLANIMINLAYDKPIQVSGPNNISYHYYSGYESISNTIPGKYIVTQEGLSRCFDVYANQTTTISTL